MCMFSIKNIVFIVILVLSLMLLACNTLFPKVASVLIKNQGELSVNVTSSDGVTITSTAIYQTNLVDAYLEGEGVNTEKKTINYDKSALTRYNIFWMGAETLALTLYGRVEVIDEDATLGSNRSLGNQTITPLEVQPNQVVYVTITSITAGNNNTSLSVESEITKK